MRARSAPWAVGPIALGVLLAGCQPSATPNRGADPAATDTPSGSPVPEEAATPTVPGASPSPDVPELVLGDFDASVAMGVVTHLAGTIGPRPAGSPADAQARAYILDAFRAAGWTVREETFALPQGGTSANVVATLPRVSLDEPHLVVGAHLDTVAVSPGGNDNATGVGVLIALATELADEAERLPDPVVLVAFGAEEFQPSDPRVHHVGSQAYVEAHGDVVPAMLSIDMVGHGDTTCICYLRDRFEDLALLLSDTADAAGLSGYRVEARGDVSDHGPFAAADIPAAHLWSYEDPTLHTAQDTADRVHPEDVQRAGALVLAWLRGVGRPA